MSTIESLSIQGIRSFGTKAEDRQVITFSSPLTLILGANGSGKTTIIECLKYALTGELPPGSNKGQSFVHDPKIFDYSESLAQVKLVVKNIKNEKMIVTRSMKISIKRGKPSFERLDSTIHFEGQDKRTISKRCVDVDFEMCQFMGVSKAILNNVIFCHQEDSCWPLDEAKKLKEKFDAIFGTTEYNKAIEKFIKMRKTEMENLKLKESELKFMEHIKKEAENKNLDLDNAKSKLNDLDGVLNGTENELKPVNNRLEQIYKIELEVSKLESERIELSTSLKNYKEQITKILSKIKNQFNGDIYELEQEIREFRVKMTEKEIQLSELNEKLLINKNHIQRLQKQLSELDRKRVTLIGQRQQEQELISNRASNIQNLCKVLTISSTPSSSMLITDSEFDLIELPENDINEILLKIHNRLLQEDKKISELKEQTNQIDQQKQIEIDGVRENKIKTENDIQSKKRQQNEQKNELVKLKKQIQSIEQSANKLKKLTEDIDKLNATYENFVKSIDLDELKKEINLKRLNINQLQDKLENYDEQLIYLNSIEKFKQELQLKQKEYDKRQQDIQRLKNKHSHNLKVIFENRTGDGETSTANSTTIINENFKRNVQSVYDDLQNNLKQLNNTINKLKLKQKEYELMRKTCKDELIKYEKDLEKHKDKIFDKLCNNEYDEFLEKCKENITKLQLEHGTLKSSETIYKKYITQIEDNPSCPLCHKNMSHNEILDIKNELTDEIYHLPENIERIENQLKFEQNKYEELLKLKPIIENVEQLEIEIPKCKEKLHNIEDELKKITKNIEINENSLNKPNQMINLTNNMLGDMSLLDEAIKDIRHLESELNELKVNLPDDSSSSSSSSQTLENVQKQKSQTGNELKNERCEVDKLQDKYDKQSETLNKIREAKNSKKDEQIRLQEGVQALSQIKSQHDEINKKIQILTKEIQELEIKLEPLKIQLSLKIDEKQQLKEENTRKIESQIMKLNNWKKIDDEIQRCTKELKQFAVMNLANQLENLKVEIKRYTEEENIKEKLTTDLTESIEQIKNDISKQEILERDLLDNKELKILQQKLNVQQEKYDALSKNYGDLNYKNIRIEKEQLNKKREMITVKRGEILGQKGEILNVINKLKSELQETKFKNSVMNYRKIYYEVEILKKIITDLGQYRLALEWALMKFHSEKMQKINTTIRELWRQIYRGNDVDYIQIQTDDGMKSSIATTTTINSADRKRNYNYRLIQCKNGGQEIDMRGRCSAGQKILASLIIRIALAETFSSNCGLLALDEPTTNLDRCNIISLCEALNNIIEERQQQSNFMLIVITHDEQFTSSLGRIRLYQKVSRNDEGKSTIKRIRCG